jgi:hypothetical protein
LTTLADSPEVYGNGRKGWEGHDEGGMLKEARRRRSWPVSRAGSVVDGSLMVWWCWKNIKLCTDPLMP